MSDLDFIQASKVQDSPGYIEGALAFDTETTSTNYAYDEVISYGLASLDGKINIERFFMPRVPIDPAAYEVHNISIDDLEDIKAKHFSKKDAEEFLAIVKDKTLIIHNAEFDVNFMSKHLVEHGFQPLTEYCTVIDSYELARTLAKRYKSLDGLMKEYSINIERESHGAWLDAMILSKVFPILNTEFIKKFSKTLYYNPSKTEDIKSVNYEFSFKRLNKTDLPITKILDEEVKRNQDFIKRKIKPSDDMSFEF